MGCGVFALPGTTIFLGGVAGNAGFLMLFAFVLFIGFPLVDVQSGLPFARTGGLVMRHPGKPLLFIASIFATIIPPSRWRKPAVFTQMAG